MEEVAAELGGAGHWYQLYWSRDDELTESLVHRAQACGSEAIVVTSTPPTSAGARATSTSAPSPSPGARASRSTPPTRFSGGS